MKFLQTLRSSRSFTRAAGSSSLRALTDLMYQTDAITKIAMTLIITSQSAMSDSPCKNNTIPIPNATRTATTIIAIFCVSLFIDQTIAAGLKTLSQGAHGVHGACRFA